MPIPNVTTNKEEYLLNSTDFYFTKNETATGKKVVMFCRRNSTDEMQAFYPATGTTAKFTLADFRKAGFVKAQTNHDTEIHVYQNDRLLACFKFFEDAYVYMQNKIVEDEWLPADMDSLNKIKYTLTDATYGELMTKTLIFSDNWNLKSTVITDPVFFSKKGV